MKRILASLAKRFRTFAGHSTGDDTEPVSSLAPSAPGTENDGSQSRAGISSAQGFATAPIVPTQKRIIQLPMSQPREMKDAASSNPDFITRQELQRELDLLRRLIESRK